jgi:DNA-binding winged helix-turn-helix (wHTH) protein
MLLSLGRDLELDTALFELRRGGQRVALEPQAYDVLVYLVSHRDRVVLKEELMDAVWGGRFVTEAAVTSRIKQVRRALGDDGQAQRAVRTVHGRGYQFVGPVASPAAAYSHGATRPDTEPPRVEPVRYTRSDDLHIAYQVSGGGPCDVVLISGFASHLELDWADPRHAHFLRRLGTMGRLIRFDKRGTGMSDRPSGLPDLETRMHDVLAVMDAVGSERAVLCGYSEGGPMAVLMAATHPERVASLVLYASYAKRTWAPDYPWGQRPEDREVFTDQLVMSWDWAADLRYRCPSGDEQMQQWWAQRMRSSGTPSTIRALMDMNSLVDVRQVLPSVRVPVLVMHRVDDLCFDAGQASYIAARIPGATLRLLPGADHLVCGDPDQLLDEIEPFVARTAAAREVPHFLAAVAAPAAATAEEVDRVATALVGRGGSRRVTADGAVVVLFDGPATAVRAGLAALEPGSQIGVAIDEVPREGDRADGPGVALAQRLARTAPDRQLLVSSTAQVLLSGSGVVLEPWAGGSHLGEAGPQTAYLARSG